MTALLLVGFSRVYGNATAFREPRDDLLDVDVGHVVGHAPAATPVNPVLEVRAGRVQLRPRGIDGHGAERRAGPGRRQLTPGARRGRRRRRRTPRGLGEALLVGALHRAEGLRRVGGGGTAL
eukprot:CAMPEP_0175523384 /NCGR_PEP_ID=MMETSP0096-20121207/18039_1 /TAXON_ID=311494 /ORGANISM="Alexandrium monilatum, Strain CCMP3105" /LENGTH=121 /DNA_ID=CAMNT_0016825915 /DNA_START=366 /DNA_END=727 /DNA_ORIENTATION=+